MSAESRRRIAVLFHAGDRHLLSTRYIVHYLAEFWREDGHEVRFLYGVDHHEPADLVLVHINLSVVPDEYMEFATRYPVALNAKIGDIRKSTISSNLVKAGDDWTGPVIVKSDLNYAGLPEHSLNRSWFERRVPGAFRLRRLGDRWMGRGGPFRRATDYEIFDQLSDVPQPHLTSPHVVVERFLPEAENGLFFTRVYQFLGNSWSCTRLGSPQRIVKATGSVHVEDVEPHPEVLEWRDRLSIDYGKLDYVVHDGRPVLLDVNKTTGASAYRGADEQFIERIRAGRRALANGIYAYF